MSHWRLIDINPDPITDNQGNILIWQPPAKLRDKLVQDRNKPQADDTFDGLDPATIQAIPCPNSIPQDGAQNADPP